MKKYKFIENIPSTGYNFEPGDEIFLRKGAEPPYRWEIYKFAADANLYPASITKTEWEKLKQIDQENIDVLLQLDQDSIDKLNIAYTNEEIEGLINDGVLQSTSGFIVINSLDLPTPTVDYAFSVVGQGLYSRVGQESVLVPTNHIGILLWSNGEWSLGAIQEVPNNIDQKINQQKGIAGGLAPLDITNQVPSQFINSYTKEETDDFINDLDSNKVDKETGKSLSTNDYTDSDKEKVSKLIIDGDGRYVLANNGEYRKLSGTGGGSYNVTNRNPLSLGQYHTLESAVITVSTDADIENDNKKGTIITFESSPGVWDDYRFIGNVEEFNLPAYWELVTDKNVIKEINYNGEDLIKDSAGRVYLNIETTVEQTLDPNSTNAVASQAVAAEFANLSSRYGAALSLSETGDEDNKVYSISLLDENGEILSTTDEFTAGGGGGGGEGPSTTKIVLTKMTENPTVKEGDRVNLSYYFDHRNTDDDTSTGMSGRAVISVITGAASRTFEINLNPDRIYNFDATDYLLVGSNTVRVRVEVDNGETIQVTQISWRVQVVTLRLTSSFDYAQLFPKGSAIVVPYALNGSGIKTLKLYLNGLEIDNRTISTSSATGSFQIPTTTLNHGSHSVQMVAELEVSNTVTLLSNSIYFDVAVTQPGVNTPIITTRFNYRNGTIIGPGARPYVETYQFEPYTIYYAGYNPTSGQNLITVQENGINISSINTSFVQRTVESRQVSSGQMSGKIILGSTEYLFNIIADQSNIDIEEPTDFLVFKLNALGRTNTDINKTVWENNGVNTTFSNVQFAGDGWTGNSLKLKNGGSAVINYKPFDVTNIGSLENSFALTTKIKITEVSDPSAVAISCMTNGVGFEITAEEARMRTSGGSEVLMKFSSGREYNIAFVSMPIAGALSSEYEQEHTEMVFLFINGILSGGAQRGVSDSIYQQNPVNITLGNTQDLTLDVYNLRVYRNYLTPDQVLDIHMLDLNSVNEILDKYAFNNILDEEGEVSVDSLPLGMRYVIVTGQQANGMSTVEYAAAINDKDNRYEVTEMLHVIKGDNTNSLNWKCVGGCIRLQGTSSLAYPIKNYRIYFRSASSSSVFGQVYLGVDAQGNGGTLLTDSKPKISFRNPDIYGKRPAPVNVWCLKADFAESSSSHNTGMARITNDTLVKANLPTPAQKHVAPSHPYDVRTTVDGEPCYLFTRNTLSDKPRFIGKYNFNNDKATEEVFGFLNIPGYHDAQWVQDKFGGENPTECWEFLNNDYPMGMYLEDDFDTTVQGQVDGVTMNVPKWTQVFEARFPDVHEDYQTGALGKPYYLERWVKWVKSTQGNPTKFRNELAEYADVPHLCAYFMFTQMFGAVDQMVKNAMLGFWYNPDVDKVLAYYIFYDNDTILGVRNDGRLKYHWDIDRQTLDPENTASAGQNIYAYMGHGSVLWNNLESQFTAELQTAYNRIRTVLDNDTIFKYFDVDQAGKFAERIYNLDATYKYIIPKTKGVDLIINGNITNTKYSHLEAMQGSRASHRRWWLENRLDLFDARYSTGQYTLTDIAWKGISSPGAKVSAVLGRDYYVEFKREGTTLSKQKVLNGQTFTYTYDQTANVGTIFHLYGGRWFSKLDMSDWGGFTDLGLPNLPQLEELILGKASRTYTLSELVIGTKMPMLEKIDITNYTMLPNINLASCTRLKEVRAAGCLNMGSIALPSGAPLTYLQLPQNLTTLSLIGLPLLTNAGIVFPNGQNVKNLNVQSSPNIDWENLFDTYGGIENIRITGINKSGNLNWLRKFENLGGIDNNGNTVPYPRLVGTFYIDSYLEDAQYLEYRTKFPELNIIQPEYSVFKIHEVSNITQSLIQDSENVQNLDNNTGYSTGVPYTPSGHLQKILSNRFRCLGKQGQTNLMSICKLHDLNSRKFADNVNPELATEALLGGQQGDIWVYEPTYWYKGVTDFDKGVHYAAFAYGKKPSNPTNTVKITKSQIIGSAAIGSITSNSLVRRGYTSINDAIGTSTTLSTVKVAVSGYKYIKFTHFPFTSILPDVCSSFTNSSGIILQDVRHNFDNYSFGTEICRQIPANAAFIYITMPKSYIELGEDFSICLSNSENPIDWEYDWIESKEKLVAPVDASFINNKYRTVDALSRVDMTEVVVRNNLVARGFKQMDYETFKNIKNLIYFKYGARDIQKIVGDLGAASDTSYGFSMDYGMQDTSNNGLNFRPVYKVRNSLGETISVNAPAYSVLGYESFYNAYKLMYFDPLDVINIGNIGIGVGNTTNNFISLAVSRQSNQRLLLLPHTGIRYVDRLMFGKYMDLFKTGLQSDVLASSTTYYADATDIASSTISIVIRLHNAADSASQGLFSAYSGAGLSNSAIRLMYDGPIQLVNNVQTYKNIVEVR